MLQPDRHRDELRLGAATVETGILAEVGVFEVGDWFEVDGSAGIIRAIEPVPGESEPKLILEHLPRSA
jgi:hypothetical protein